MAENDAERTEAPTGRRREEARQQGQIARSPDLTSATVMLAGILLLRQFGLMMFVRFTDAMETMLSAHIGSNPTRPDDVGTELLFAMRAAALIGAPILVGIMLVALLVSFAQVGFIFSGQVFDLNFGKFNPIRGLQKLLDMRSGVRLVMSLAKLSVIVLIAGTFVLNDLPMILHLSQLEPLPMFSNAADLVYDLAIKLLSVLLTLAAADYFYQRWQIERDLRMTKEEVKEEMKRMDGDPVVKQRRARIARQLALQRLNRDVPRADVIVTNPTHFSIALLYDTKTMRAPKVIAKGADFLAMQIRQIATVHHIPMVERRELAQALYKNVEVGQEVPPELYNAVAEILAYVYRINGRRIA